jgi:hypothetical protein
MKKLMTVIAACVTGLAAWATDTVALNDVFDATKVDADTWQTGWAGDDVLTNAEKAALKTVSDVQVLHIETGSSPLSRLVTKDGSMYTATDKVYFDVEADLLGQVLDDVPLSTLPETAKFALFLLDGNLVEEAPNGTNLYAIVRNPYDTTGGKALVRLTTEADQLAALLAGKARVTIQGYKNVLSSGECMGFRVYLGGEIASEGGTQTYVQPLKIAALYAISTDNAINWTDAFISTTYLADKVVSTFSEETTRMTVLLSCLDGNAEVEKFDLVGNADISTVTITDSDLAFIPAETAQAKVTLKDVTITAVDPADAYANGILTKSCTITVSSDKPIIKVTGGDAYLESKGNNQWAYTFASGNDIAFTGLDAAATVTIGGTATSYATFAEAVAAIASETQAVELKLGQDVASSSEVSLSGADITIDLYGHTLTGGDPESYSEVINVSSGKTTITDTSDAKNGRIVVSDEVSDEAQAAVAISSGELVINAGIFDGAVSFIEGALSISGGSFRKAENGTDAFALASYLSSATAASGQIGDVDYWVVTAGEAPSTYTVTFVTAYGTAPQAQTGIAKNGRAAKPETDPVDESGVYKFLGWFAPDATDAFDFGNTAITANITLTAKWEAKGWADYLGDADTDGAYKIDDEDDLIALQANAKTLGTANITFKLTGNIALTKAWKSIGLDKGDVYSFDGTFNGNGKTISNVVFADLANGNKDSNANNYRGFFGKVSSTGVIKNLTVSGTGFGTVASTEYGCALIVGVLDGGTITNCTAEGTITSGTHNAGGICIKLNTGKILGCTNKVNVTGNYTKVGGVCVFSNNGGTIEDCVNEGSVTAVGDNTNVNAGRDGVGGIIGYAQNGTLTIKNCTNKGVISKGVGACACNAVGQIIGYYSSGTLVLEGTNTVLPGYSTIGVTADWNNKASPVEYGTSDAYLQNVSGLNYAVLPAVDDLVTLVKDDALAADKTNKVMAHGRTYTLAATDSKVTFDESLNTVTVALADTLTNDYEIAKAVVGEASDKVTTYSVAAKSVEPTYEPVDAGSETTCNSQTEADALKAAIEASKTTMIKTPTGVPEDFNKTAYVGLFEVKVVEVSSGSYAVDVVLTSQATTDLQAQVDADVKLVELTKIAAAGDEGTVATEVTTTPGLYYTVYSGSETPATLTQDGDSVLATGEKMSLSFKKLGTRGFYKIGVSVQKIEKQAK